MFTCFCRLRVGQCQFQFCNPTISPSKYRYFGSKDFNSYLFNGVPFQTRPTQAVTTRATTTPCTLICDWHIISTGLARPSVCPVHATLQPLLCPWPHTLTEPPMLAGMWTAFGHDGWRRAGGPNDFDLGCVKLPSRFSSCHAIPNLLADPLCSPRYIILLCVHPRHHTHHSHIPQQKHVGIPRPG